MKASELFQMWKDKGSSLEDPTLLELKYSSEDMIIPYSVIERICQTLSEGKNMIFDSAFPVVSIEDDKIVIEGHTEVEASVFVDPNEGERYGQGEEISADSFTGYGPLFEEYATASGDAEQFSWEVDDAVNTVLEYSGCEAHAESQVETTAEFEGDMEYFKSFYDASTGYGMPGGIFYSDEIIGHFTNTFKIIISK